MTIPNSVKLPNLRTLHLKLHEPGWTFHDSKEKDKAVLEEFDTVQKEFAMLDPKYASQRIIGHNSHTSLSGTKTSSQTFAGRWVPGWPTLRPCLLQNNPLPRLPL